MLELLFALLMNILTLQNGGQKPANDNKAEASKATTITTNKAAPTQNTDLGIGSGGWDPNN